MIAWQLYLRITKHFYNNNTTKFALLFEAVVSHDSYNSILYWMLWNFPISITIHSLLFLLLSHNILCSFQNTQFCKLKKIKMCKLFIKEVCQFYNSKIIIGEN